MEPDDLATYDSIESSVLFSVAEEPNGGFRFTVYDVRRDPANTGKWKTTSLITRDTIPRTRLLNLEFSNDQLAEWGRGLIETLVAGYRVQAGRDLSINDES